MIIAGLVSRQALNGAQGTIKSFDDAKGRYGVSVPVGRRERCISLKESNLIPTLELSAELAILSACDTFKGELRTDGVVGIARSFLAAGASSLGVSLWPVSDTATRELMARFYDRYVAGDDAATAMRGAMRAMIGAGRWTPKQWAAFVVYGL